MVGDAGAVADNMDVCDMALTLEHSAMPSVERGRGNTKIR